jgi:membrane dipeptidase
MRLVDLHCNWLCQYATETTLFDTSLYADVPDRLGQLDGYLLGTSIAVLACGRRSSEWKRVADPWSSLNELIARCDAEFSGRLLIGPEDVRRWRSEPAAGLCWGVLGVAGFDYLVREAADIDRVRGLFERGVRVFQLVESEANALAGSAEPGDERGLTDLGRELLARLCGLGKVSEPGPVPVVDLAHLNPRSMADVLDWLGCEPVRNQRPLILYSHGALSHARFESPRALSRENLARLRELSGLVGFTPGPPFYITPEELQAGIEIAAAMPFEGSAGYRGIGLATDFLGIDCATPGLGDAAQIKKWISQTFDRQVATSLLAENARPVLLRAAGVADPALESTR